jgi:hypothetical protein
MMESALTLALLTAGYYQFSIFAYNKVNAVFAMEGQAFDSICDLIWYIGTQQ